VKFRVLSHAGLEVKSESKVLLCDPWLIGSTYWRSWWNYPEPDANLVKELKPDAIYLTHVHWDHFAAPSLRLFSRDTLIILPQEPAGRMARDLDSIGFHNYIEVGHGDSVFVGEIKITVYQFSIFTDSAAIIESEDTVLFNANDAKFMGAPLDQILYNHPKIDFVFRSHSSANSRVMYSFIDAPEESSFEDRDRYINDFLAFSKSTGARYAVPFASNHCHLHKDVYEFNDYIVTPEQVEIGCNRVDMGSLQLKVMLSGDSWDEKEGFDIKKNDFFENREEHLIAYRAKVSEKLEVTYKREAKAKVNLQRAVAYFEKVFVVMPWSIRRYFKGRPLLYVLEAGEGKTLLEIDFYQKVVRRIEEFTDDSNPMQIYTQASLFNHCIAAHLFSHLAISKRVHFRCTRESLRAMRVWAYFINFYEYDLLPIRKAISLTFVTQWARRWREIRLYFIIIFDLAVGRGFNYSKHIPKVPRRRYKNRGGLRQSSDV
jgi:UDP-MurNAc hydroxylase